ncbi:MAG TPA: hypothetical protein VFG21_04965 [Xanthomonadaceae bacterium]|nr:hypothetical protein [Xanthomonadaceae bacterium]
MTGGVFSRLSAFERLLQLFTPVRPGEGRAVFLMLAQVFLLLLAYYLVRPVREALILAEGSAELRSYAVGSVALVLIFLVPLYTLLFSSIGRRGSKSAVLRWVAWFFVSNLLLFHALGRIGVPVSVPFFVWMGVFNVMVVAQFWAFAADLLNVRSGQRLFALIAVGGALGAWCGSQLSGRLFALAGPWNLMLASAALLACVVAISRRVESSIPEGSHSLHGSAQGAREAGIGRLLGGFALVARSRYLTLIAVFVTLLNLVGSTGGYILSSYVEAHAAALSAADPSVDPRAVIGAFYGDYWSWVTLLQFVLQLLVVPRLFQRWGIRTAIVVVPVLMLLNYGLVALLPVFALVRFMAIVEGGANYSVHATTCNALYLPVPREHKYVGKTTIDTFFWRFGDLLHALLILVLARLAGQDMATIVLANLGFAAVLVGVAVAIGRHHHRRVQAAPDSVPPRVAAPMRDVYVPAGQLLVFSIPEQAFQEPEPGEALGFEARAASGELPGWIRFDRANHTFAVRPPAGNEGCVEVELIARDIAGRTVCSRFAIRHGIDPRPRFLSYPSIALPAAAAPGSGGDAGTAKAC